MKTSETGLNLIKQFESLQLKAYLCPAGIWTIGYGHTGDVHKGDEITESFANCLLREDVAFAEKAIHDTGVELSQNKFDALVSFIFNIGAGAFKKSTLRRKMIADVNDPTIKDEFMRWTMGGGVVLKGLVRRREMEAELWETK